MNIADLAPIDTVFFQVIHVAAGAAWFGATLGLTSLAKRAADLDPKAFRLVAETISRRTMLANIFGVATLLTGLLMIFAVYGGFSSPLLQPTIHMAMSLAFVLIVFGFVFVKPASDKMLKLTEGGTEVPEEALKLNKRLAMGSGILQLGWLVLLVLMFLG